MILLLLSFYTSFYFIVFYKANIKIFSFEIFLVETQLNFLSQYEEAQVKIQKHIFKKLERDKILALE